MWSIALVEEEGEKPMYALLPDDGTRGLLLGEIDEVEAAIERLMIFRVQGIYDGILSPHDKRLGGHWLTAGEAALEYNVPPTTIRSACQAGNVPHAQKNYRDEWEFPALTFRGWLKKHQEETRGRR